MTKDFSFIFDISRSKELVKKGDRVIVGYATTYDVKMDNLQITREALDEAKDQLLEKYSTVLFNHDSNRPIGKIVEVFTDDIGLMIKMVLSKSENEIWEKVKDGTINKFSIQGRVLESRPVEGDEHILQVTKLELFEAGLVSIPGDAEAKTISWWIARALTKSESIDNVMEELIKKLKTIQNRCDESVKADIGNLIKELETRLEVIAKLQVLSEKLTDEEKETVDLAIGMLKRQEKENKKEEEDEEEKMHPEYDLSDKSEERPIFQLNLEDSALVQDEKDSNKFRKQLLKKGKWYHWSADGNVLNITDDIIQNLIKNFKKKIVENVYVPLTHTNDPSKNTGEVVGLEKTEDGLDAIIEIKEDSIIEKIKKGLIKSISASIDPNYLIKKTNQFAGPTLLHAALVTEPYIKGMREFIPLSDDYSGRQIINLEDEKPSIYALFEMVKDTLKRIEEKSMKIEKPITQSAEEKSEEKIEEKPDEIEEAKKKEDDYVKCLEKETKAGKSLADAVKICKVKYDFNPSEEVPEDKSGEESEDKKEPAAEEKVDLSDAEKVYEEYLKQGKIVPAQKDAFIKLLASSKALDLSDTKVGLAEDIKAFLKSQPKIVNFEENGTSTPGEEDPSPKESTDDTVPEEALNLFKGMGLSDEDSEKAWKEAQKIAKEEKESKESTLFA